MSTLQNTTIVDSDVHLTVSNEDLAPYTDQPYRDLVSTGRIFPNPSTWDSTMGGSIEYLERAEDFSTPEAVTAFCEEYGVDHPLVNTNPLVNVFSDPAVATHLMRAHNDYLLDRVLDETDDCYGLAALSLQEPEETAEEIDRLGDERRIVGGYIPNPGVNPPPGDPRYDPVYQALEDNDLPVAFHANNDAAVYDFPRQSQGFRTYLEAHSVFHMWYQTMTIASLVGQGTPVKFPDLRFVTLEAGISWVPYIMFRLNRECAMRKREAPLLERQPEEYIRDQFYFASQPLAEPMNVEHLKGIIDMIGCDSLLFASDYPHWDFDHPSAFTEHLERLFDGDQRRQVLQENPREVFGV